MLKDKKAKVKGKGRSRGDDDDSKRSKMKVHDLPRYAIKDDSWCHRFLATVVRYAGCVDTPWAFDDEEEFRRILLLIWEVVYPGTTYTDNIHIIVRPLVCISLLDYELANIVSVISVGLSAPLRVAHQHRLHRYCDADVFLRRKQEVCQYHGRAS